MSVAPRSSHLTRWLFYSLNTEQPMNYADPADETSARQQQAMDVALANRKPPAALSAVCLNGDCGEPSQPGTSYWC